MSKVFTDVEVFLQACGQQHANYPTGQNDLSRLYQNLIIEEYNEFRDALAAGNDAEQLDACFDMMWVIIGYMKARGWDCESSWDEVAKSNLSKITILLFWALNHLKTVKILFTHIMVNM